MVSSDRIDWNLVPALDALLSERNVSRAARRIGTSQSSMSGALARLRRHFDDELLVRQGNNYVLSPLAERLHPLVREAVTATSTTLAATGQFAASESDHLFRIAATEYGQTVVGPALTAEVARQAPGVRINFVAPFSAAYTRFEDALQATDGALAPREVLKGQPCTGLLPDEWVCVVSADHPTVGDVLSVDDVATLRWVAPTIRGQLLNFMVDGLGSLALEPRVGVTTESFTAVPFLVAGTTRIGLLQGRVARRLATSAGVRVLPCPWPVQALNLTFFWDQKHQADPAHAWLRSVIDHTMRALAGA